MRLTTIGTGTAAPHPSRVSAGHLVEAGDARILLDCGSGVLHRMAALGVDWPSITHVAISHFHPDHVIDLVPLLQAWRWGQLPARSAPMTLYGPPGLGDFLERMAGLFGAWVLAPGYPLTVREVAPHERVTVASGVALSTFDVPHTPESVAYSIGHAGKRLVYTGDTGVSDALGIWAAHADLLLAECSLPDAMAITEHLTPAQAGQLASRAHAARLVLTHFYAPVEAVNIAAEVARSYAGPTVLATDGWSTEV